LADCYPLKFLVFFLPNYVVLDIVGEIIFCTTHRLESSKSNCRISKWTCLPRSSNYFSSSFYGIQEIRTFEIVYVFFFTTFHKELLHWKLHSKWVLFLEACQIRESHPMEVGYWCTNLSPRFWSMKALGFFFYGGVPIIEFNNMELAQNVGNYGKLEIQIQSVTLLATWSQCIWPKKKKTQKTQLL
jgi:hypothetical protein